METLSPSPTLCGEIPPVIGDGGYSEEADSKWSFGISFVVKQQTHVNRQSCRQWYETWWYLYNWVTDLVRRWDGGRGFCNQQKYHIFPTHPSTNPLS